MNGLTAMGWSEGRSPDTNEDAFGFISSTEGGRSCLEVAVADGATSTLYSGEWARTLVDAALSGWATISDREILDAIDDVRREFNIAINDAPKAPFVARKWQQLGSQATLLSARIVEGENDSWLRAIAVGDCELLCVDHRRCAPFPIMRACDFTNTPDLITSRVGDGASIRRYEGPIGRNDVVVFATDAVGHSLLLLAETSGTAEVLRRLRLLSGGSAHHSPLSSTLLSQDATDFGDDATLVICGMTLKSTGRDNLLRSSFDPAPRKADPLLVRIGRFAHGFRHNP